MTHVQDETAEDLLDTAWALAKAGRDADADEFYARAGALRPARQLRAYWPLALTRPGKTGEEWATPALKRADLHINYQQDARATEILNRITEPKLRGPVLVGHARMALGRGAAADALALVTQARGIAPGSSYAAIIQGAALLAAGRTAEDGGSPADVTGPGQPCAATGRATRHRNEPSVDADGGGHPPLAQPELDDADPLPPRRAPVPQRGAPARRGPAARNPARQARRAPGRPRCETAPRAPAPAPEWDRDDNAKDLGLNALGTAFPDPGPEGVADAPAGRPGPPAPQLSPA